MATPDQQEKSSRFFSRWKILLLGLGTLLLCSLLLSWYMYHRRHVWTNDAYLDGYQISISADIEARIITLFVDEGDFVQEGQLLCQLDESIFNSQKLDAETSVEMLKEKVKLQKVEMEKLRDIYFVALQEYENEIISYIDFDKIEKDFRYSEAQYKVAEAELANPEAQGVPSRAATEATD